MRSDWPSVQSDLLLDLVTAVYPRLLLMTSYANRLGVFTSVRPTFVQRYNMIALRCQGYLALC